MVGDQGVISTTLKALNTDPFEIVNLVGKKLVLISDSERYSADLNILKAYTGGDPLGGRKMYTQGNFAVTGEGIIVIVANNPLNSRDNSNAIIRRIRTIQTGKTFISRDPLFINVRGEWTGSLVEELPGIINWILNLPHGSHEKYIVNFYDNVKSLSGLYEQTIKQLSYIFIVR